MYIEKNNEKSFIGEFAGRERRQKKEMLINLIEVTFTLSLTEKKINEDKIKELVSIPSLKQNMNNKNAIMHFGKWMGLWDDNYNLTNLAKLISKKGKEYGDKYIKKYFDKVVPNLLIKTKDGDNDILIYNPLILFLEYCMNKNNKIDKNNINWESILMSFEWHKLNKSNFFYPRNKKYGKNEKLVQFLHLLKNTSYFHEIPKKNPISIKFNDNINISNLLSKCNKRFHKKPLKEYTNYLNYSLTKLAIYLGTKLSWHQKIYYGAPGTGKSYKLKEESENYFYDENIKRITFHPSYSYSNFVGSYKPKKDGDKTVFDFVPGPLINILIEAFQNSSENYLLIIEEINRANVSEVFGDFFQLIERDQEGKSQYDINVSEDLKDYLEKNKKGSLNPDELRFPENLYISATMNSSDQGTFPLDTAFKRRWDFEYIGIDDNEEEVENVYFKLPGDDKKVKWNWNSFRKSINEILLDINSTINEDKLLGPFFIGGNLENNDPEDNTEIIKNKVVPYLYEDVLKYLGREAMKEIFNLDPKNKEYSNKTLSEIIQKFDGEKFENIFSEKLKSLYQKYEKERTKKST